MLRRGPPNRENKNRSDLFEKGERENKGIRSLGEEEVVGRVVEGGEK